MKSAAFLALVLVLQLTGVRSNAQNVSFSVQNKPMTDVLAMIGKQTGYELFFNAQLVDSITVSLTVENVPLEQVLGDLLHSRGLIYSIKYNTIVVTAAGAPEKSATPRPATPKKAVLEYEFRGIVKDSFGEPLEGATAMIRGSKKAVQTNRDGVFSLRDTARRPFLLFSFAGYETKEIEVPKKETPLLLVTLNVSGNPLDAMQVTAYGKTSRRLSTGDITTITAREIALNPVPDVLQAVQGRVPGMFITQQTGQPNGGFRVLIRSQTTTAGQQQPLYVVDGVAYPANGPLPMIGYASGNDPAFPLKGGNALNYLDPSLIESVNILKGPDATAIYGSRGAYGVVIITTKKANPGLSGVGINFYSGFTQTGITPKLLNTQEYLDLRHDAFRYDGAVPGEKDLDINGVWDTTSYTDWHKVLQGCSAGLINTNISYTGGNSLSSFLISANYSNQGNVQMKKGNVRNLGINFSIGGKTKDQKFSIGLTGSFTNNLDDMGHYDFSPSFNSRGGNVTGVVTAPDAPQVYLPDGSLNWSSGLNPASTLNVLYNNSTNNLVANMVMRYAPVPGLSIQLNAGYVLLSAKEFRGEPSSMFDPNPNTPNQTNSTLNYYSSNALTLDPNISYRRRLGSKGKIELTAGATLQNREDDNNGINASGFISDALIYNPATQSNHEAYYINAIERYIGVFGILNYNWDDKYIVNLNGRRDGSTKFGPDKQFGNFGSVGAAWNFSEENWFRRLRSVIDFAKIKASYGVTGGDEVGNYLYLNTYFGGAPGYQGAPTLVPLRVANPDLQWQQNKQSEISLLFDLFKGAVSIEALYYRTNTSKQLVASPLSTVTGNNFVIGNSQAIVRTTGWEMTLKTVNFRKKNFSWETSFNITIDPTSKLISYPGGNAALRVFGPELAIGRSITSFAVFNYAGVDPATGQYLFTNAKGVTDPFVTFPLGLHNDSDRTVILDAAPRYYGGIGNTLRYKQFTLNFFITFKDRLGTNYAAQSLILPGWFNYNTTTDALKRWRKPGDRTNVPAATQDILPSFISQSHFSISSGGQSSARFARLSNVNLSYTFKPSVLKKMRVRGMNVYLAGQNLATVTSYKNLDPENLGLGAMGPLRVFTGGFSVNF